MQQYSSDCTVLNDFISSCSLRAVYRLLTYGQKWFRSVSFIALVLPNVIGPTYDCKGSWLMKNLDVLIKF